MHKPTTRRTLLAGIGGGILALAAGPILIRSNASSILVRYIETALPGVKIDEASARLCVSELLSEWSLPRRLALGTAWSVLGIEGTGRLSKGLGNAPRLALTRFLLRSNFFSVPEPRKALIVYKSMPPQSACNNPFAREAALLPSRSKPLTRS